MKTLLQIAFIALGIILGSAMTARSDAPLVGRYQISVVHTQSGDTIYRVDTQTGDVMQVRPSTPATWN